MKCIYHNRQQLLDRGNTPLPNSGGEFSRRDMNRSTAFEAGIVSKSELVSERDEKSMRQLTSELICK